MAVRDRRHGRPQDRQADRDRGTELSAAGAVVRPAVAADLEALQTFDPFWGDRARDIADDLVLVAVRDAAPVGYVSWLPRGFVGRDFVSFLCVHPSHRRRGLAAMLLRAAERRVGKGRLFISTEEDNSAMLALLPADGWRHAGTVAGANEDGRAELFFYKDLPPGRGSTKKGPADLRPPTP